MRRLVLSLMTGVILLASVAAGQWSPPPPPPVPGPGTPEWVCPHEDPDEICIVFDWPDLCCENCLDFYFGSALSAYVVIQNMTSDSISGFEFCLCNWDGAPFGPPPNCFITGYTYPPNAINAATEPCFAVGLGVPLPSSGWCTTILTINMLIFCQDCWCFGLEPMNPASIEGEMAYADGNDPGLLKVMNPCTGDDPPQSSCYMTCINCPWCNEGPIANEPSTWGNLKSLYR